MKEVLSLVVNIVYLAPSLLCEREGFLFSLECLTMSHCLNNVHVNPSSNAWVSTWIIYGLAMQSSDSKVCAGQSTNGPHPSFVRNVYTNHKTSAVLNANLDFGIIALSITTLITREVGC